MVTPGVVSAAVTMIAAITFTNTISVGVLILSALVALGTVLGVVRGVRWKSSYESERAARQAETAVREALDDRNRLLKSERDDYKAKLEEATGALLEAQRTIARLEPLKDMGRVLEMVTDTFERLRDRQESMHAENRLAGDRRLKIVLEELRADRAAMLEEIRADRAALIAELRSERAA